MASNIDVSVPTPVRATTKSVRDNFVAAKDEIEALQTSEASLVVDVEAEKIRNDDQDQRLDALESGGGIDLTPIEDDITDLDGRVTVNEGDIAANTADIAVEAQSREAADDALGIRIDNLSASGGYDDTQVKADIADLDGKVTVNEGDIATNVTDIADIKADTDKNTAEIADHEVRIDDLEARPISTGGGGGVPEPDVIKDPTLGDVALVRETTVINNPDYDSTDPDSEEFLNSGKWRTLTTGDIDTDPTTTFAFDPNNPEYAGLDTQLRVNRFLAEKTDNSVKKDGDTMTGALEVKDTVKADELHTIKLDTGQNSNMSLKRNNATKLLLSSDQTLAYQPLKYNAVYNLNHEHHLITKGYVDERHLITKGYVDDAIAGVSVDGLDELADQVAENTDDIIELFDAANAVSSSLGDSTVKTGVSLDESMTRSFYDEDNNRVLSVRSYFNEHNTTKTPHLIATDMDTGVSVGLKVNNVMSPNRVEQLAPGFKLGDDWIFPAAENPKDSPFIKLDPSNNISYYAGENSLKVCRSWGIINFVVDLDGTGRFKLLVGNPSERLDPNGGSGSAQAQVTLLLDTEDLINQNQIEEYTDNKTGLTYGTLTKSLSTSRGGVPKKVNGEWYTLQPNKQIVKVQIKDLPTKDVSLVGCAGGEKLAFGYLIGLDGKTRVAEWGKLNGVSVVNDRYIVWHALSEGIMCYDTVEDKIDTLFETDNWIEYGVNRIKNDWGVPEIHKALWYVPSAYTGFDNVDVPLEIIKVSTEDLSVERIKLPDNPNFACNSSSKIGLNKIAMTNFTSDVLFYDAIKKTFSTSDVNEPVGSRFCIGDDNYFTPRTTTGRPVEFVKHTIGLGSDLVANTNFLENDTLKEHNDFIQEDRARISGDEFEGPIFGPSITNLMEGKVEYLLKLATNASDNIHDIADVDDDVVMVQSRTSETEIEPGVTNRLKVRLWEDVSKYCNSTDVTYALLQPTTGAVQIWQCSNSGFGTGGSNYILNVVAETTEGDWLDPDEPIVLYRSDLLVSPYATFEMLKKYMDKIGIEIVNDSRALSLNNEDAIYSLKEGMTDLVTPRLEVATEDATTTIETMHEHSYPLFPDKDDPYYYLVPQRFVLLSRMFEGTIEGDDPKENIFCDDYSLDLWKNVIILDVKTGKTHDLPNCIVNGAQGLIYPALRGSHVITHSDGSCDVYLWISNPLRTVNYSQWGNEAAPLYRIHIPPHDQINDSDPFRNVTAKWTAIKPNKALFTFPDKNPFGNYTDDTKQFKYEIQSDTIKLKDSKTGKMHYFFRSGTKGATDFATFRLFEFIPDVDGDNPDIGIIIPVGAHPESTWGEYASGPHLIKEDTNGVQRCFMFSHPIGLTELYFVDDGAGRKPELRNYGDYTPEGTRVEDPVKKNALGRPRIVGKGILDNWYKGDQSAPQWLNHHVMDNKDRLSCTFVWFQFGYGICSLNLQNLGVIDRSNEVRLENNYKGNLNCLHIENRSQSYWGYIQESSIKNLQRFNQRTPDTHSNGSVWFFDYKTGMIADNESYYNDSRVYDSGGNRMSWRQYCRGAIEVRVNPIDSDIEIIGHDVGSETNDGEDSTDLGFSGEGITKMYDMFVLTAAGKSSSSVSEPKVFMFNPLTKSLSIVDNRETSATSLIPMPTYGVIACSCYGKKTDGTPGPIHMIEMLPEASISRIRKDATVLRKVYSVTGDSVEDDPNTWALDEPSDEPDTKQTETPDYSYEFDAISNE